MCPVLGNDLACHQDLWTYHQNSKLFAASVEVHAWWKFGASLTLCNTKASRESLESEKAVVGMTHLGITKPLK